MTLESYFYLVDSNTRRPLALFSYDDCRMHFEVSAREAQIRVRCSTDDVLRASCGYDQTNVDFYQVTALIGSRWSRCGASLGRVSRPGSCQASVSRCRTVSSVMPHATRTARARLSSLPTAGHAAWSLLPPVFSDSYWSSYA